MTALDELLYGRGDNTPNLQLLAVLEFDVLEAGILRAEDYCLALPDQSLYGELTIHDGNHNVAGLRLEGFIDDQQITVKDTGPHHAAALGTDKKGRFLVGD